MTTAYTSRPSLPRDLLERWPTPDGVSPGQWRDWDAKRRKQWLIDQTYEKTPDGWVLRTDNANSPTSQRVDEVVTTLEGGVELLTTLVPDDDGGRGDREPVRPRGLLIWLVVLVVMLVLIAALLADWGSDGSSSSDEVPVNASVPAVTAPPDESTTPPSDAVPDATITFSSIPDHIAYAKSWSDGSLGVTLNPDGTYRLVAAGVDETGHFKMTREDGVDRILFLDPGDPTGLHVRSQVSVSIEDGVLVFGDGSAAQRLSQVDALPTIDANLPPAQQLDTSGAVIDGSWVSDHPTLRWPTSSNDGVSYLITAEAATGGVDIDLDAATISGTIEAPFDCLVPRCAPSGSDVVDGTATYTIESGEVAGVQGRWGFDGIATVTTAWNAAIECTNGTCTWPYSVTFEVPYTLRLVESEGLAYLDFDQFEGVTPDGITYSIFLRGRIPFVGP
jgi:hypothetical protein